MPLLFSQFCLNEEWLVQLSIWVIPSPKGLLSKQFLCLFKFQWFIILFLWNFQAVAICWVSGDSVWLLKNPVRVVCRCIINDHFLEEVILAVTFQQRLTATSRPVFLAYPFPQPIVTLFIISNSLPSRTFYTARRVHKCLHAPHFVHDTAPSAETQTFGFLLM